MRSRMSTSFTRKTRLMAAARRTTICSLQACTAPSASGLNASSAMSRISMARSSRSATGWPANREIRRRSHHLASLGRPSPRERQLASGDDSSRILDTHGVRRGLPQLPAQPLVRRGHARRSGVGPVCIRGDHDGQIHVEECHRRLGTLWAKVPQETAGSDLQTGPILEPAIHIGGIGRQEAVTLRVGNHRDHSHFSEPLQQDLRIDEDFVRQFEEQVLPGVSHRQHRIRLQKVRDSLVKPNIGAGQDSQSDSILSEEPCSTL